MRIIGRTTALALGLVLVGALLTGCAPAKKGSGGPGLNVTPVVGGLNNPWDVVFAHDAFFFTERTGAINAVVNGQRLILHVPPDVRNTGGEGGMLGIAIDPSYGAGNRYIYTCFSTVGDVRVVRWLVPPDFSGLAQRADIVTGIPHNDGARGRHSGCRLEIGPDGFLWVGTGDAAFTGTAQDVNSLGGKVLRIDGFGNPAPGNPNLGGDPRIYTYGHRNVQGLAFRPGNGQAYAVEHGPTCDDEVNLLVGGANYGWAPGPGYNENVPMTFGGANPSVWSSGCPTIAPSGATFLDGPQWKGWNGAIAAAVLKDRHLRIFHVAADGGITGTEVALAGSPRLRSATLGPDGNLYITTDVGNGGGEIWRVTPT